MRSINFGRTIFFVFQIFKTCIDHHKTIRSFVVTKICVNLCNLWYNGIMRKDHVHPIRLKDTKQCTVCKTMKPYTDFHKMAASTDGHKHMCRTCARKVAVIRHDPDRSFPYKTQGDKIHCRKCEEYLPKSSFWSKNSYCRECTLLIGHMGNLKKYGLTRDDYVDLEKSQNGVCKICGEKELHKKRLSVDHDHSCCEGYGSCGKCIRGLLCSNCNRVLGQVNDDIDILKAMIQYLQK